MRYWIRKEKASWTYRVRNEEVLLTVKEQRNILHEISKLKANWIGHILRRICLLRQVIEGKIKGWIDVRGNWDWFYMVLKLGLALYGAETGTGFIWC
jgi:hypothetical protein